MTNKNVYQMALSAMLMAIAILIPMFSPLKVIMEPASFTLASHVAIIIAMFISPSVALSVELGATIGFFLGGFPLVVVMRALSQVIFVMIGAIILKKKPETMKKLSSLILFALFTGVIHAVGEVIVSTVFYGITTTFMYNVMVLVGFGTLVHSCVDFAIAVAVWKVIVKSPSIAKVSVIKEVLV
ncbi:MAG: hypothetical protein EOM50_04000 [Erysipelotrichia bacterium]|nr:hypothetical protein [Erysipelotrichia bacterium]